jgi:1-acyl-sn-glycerol-3-phosphate acyltransferase
MGFWRPRLIGAENYAKGQQMGAIGIFNHVSYLDAFVVVWAFCVSGVTFNFSKHLPVLGYGIRALQNLYLPPENDRSKQQASMVQLIKERYGWAASTAGCIIYTSPPPRMLCMLL